MRSYPCPKVLLDIVVPVRGSVLPEICSDAAGASRTSDLCDSQALCLCKGVPRKEFQDVRIARFY